MFKDLFVNLAIIVSFLAFTGEFFKSRPMGFSRKTQIYSGFILGILGILLMVFSIKITDTMIMDFRNFTLIIALIYGGFLSGTIVAIICSVGRIIIYGINPSSITACIIFFLILIGGALIIQTRMSTFRKFMVMNLYNVLCVSTAFSILINEPNKLVDVIKTYALISLIGGPSIYKISSFISKSNENFRRLQLFEKIIDTTQQGAFVTDTNGQIIYINGGFERITGYTTAEAIGNTPSLLKSGVHDPAFYQKMWADIKKTGQWKGEIWNKNKSEKIYPELLNISEVKDQYGNPVNYVAVFSNITTLKETENKLIAANEKHKKLSAIDGLTGIANRRTFDDTINKEWKRAFKNNHPISLIMLDIDYFKKFNDTYGHLEGDECLIKVASTLITNINLSTDLAARYGGEEFVIILPDTQETGASEVAERVRMSIEALQISHINSLVENYVTISVGVATIIPTQKSSPNQLIHHADQALYRAKENGRNQVCEYKTSTV